MITRGLSDVVHSLGDIRAFIRERLENNDNVRVLEIGCGIGNALVELKEEFPQLQCWGFNKHPFPCQNKMEGVHYIYGDAGVHIPLDDNSVDFIYSINTIQFIEDKLGLLFEAYRVLKPNGEFVFRLTDSMSGLQKESIWTVTDGVNTISMREFLKILKRPNVLIKHICTDVETYAATDSVIEFSVQALVKVIKTEEPLDLPLCKDYVVTDLSLINPNKEGYLKTNYKTIPSMKTLSPQKKVLVIAASPHGYGHLYRGEMISSYLHNNNFDVYYLSNNSVDFSPSSSASFSKLKITMGDGEASQKARDKVLEYVDLFKYDYVIIDHFPLGKLFLLENFKNLHKKMRKFSKFICVYRDVYSIDDYREMEASLDVLNHYFDKLLVFSDPKFLPLPDILTQKITIPMDYLGYLDSDYNPQITIFGGGGKYNFNFYKQTLEVLIDLGAHQSFRIALYIGANLPEDEYQSLLNSYPEIHIERHCTRLMQEINNSDITISTFGYNSFVQLLHANNYNVIVPLPKNYQEQFTRAEKFCHLKASASIILFDLKYKELLAEKIQQVLGQMLNRNGLVNLVNHLNEWK